MIQFEKFDFAAPPFTAVGTFVMTMLRADFKLYGRKDDIASVPFSGDPGRLRVSLVRHPYSWLHSYYQQIIRLPATTPQKTFDEFTLDYVQQTPGRISRMFAGYAADTCLRVEDFPMALSEFIESLGVPCAVSGQGTPSNFPGQNFELRRRVVAAEKEYSEQYDYW